MMSHPIAPIRLTKPRSATEPITYLAGDILRVGKKPYFEPHGTYDYSKARKQTATNPSLGVPQFPKANKTFAGGVVPAPKNGKNIFSPYVAALNQQSKQDYENLLAIQSSASNEAKALLAREFAEQNRLRDLLEIEALIIQGLTEEEATKYHREAKIKKIAESPIKNRIAFHQSKKDIIRDFARSRGYELPKEIVTEAGSVPVEVRFSGKEELTVKKLAKLFLSQKEQLEREKEGARMWGSQHNPSAYFPENAAASSYRGNKLPDVMGTNDRGGLNHGSLPEAITKLREEEEKAKTRNFMRAAKPIIKPIKMMEEEDHKPQSVAEQVDKIVEKSLDNRLDALETAPRVMNVPEEERIEDRLDNLETVSTPRRAKRTETVTIEEFQAELAKRKATNPKSVGDYLTKVLKQVDPEQYERLKGQQNKRYERVQAIELALHRRNETSGKKKH